MAQNEVRELVPHWNKGMIAASIAVSLLGAFTSTQMMCQARTSRRFRSALVWLMLGSLTTGFCSIWSLHFVAMLACELDLPIGLNIPLTILSAVLAVTFTFAALSADLLLELYGKSRRRRRSTFRTRRRRSSQLDNDIHDVERRDSTEALLRPSLEQQLQEGIDSSQHALVQESNEIQVPYHDERNINNSSNGMEQSMTPLPARLSKSGTDNMPYLNLIRPTIWDTRVNNARAHQLDRLNHDAYDENDGEFINDSSTEDSMSGKTHSFTDSDSTITGISSFLSMRLYSRGGTSAKNVLLYTGIVLYQGLTARNLIKGFLWSLAITSMHYVGILALKIPEGYFLLNPAWVLLSATISWIVCSVASIMMPQMEVNLVQQLLFSAIATTGVTGMHFTGMKAATFWSHAPPQERIGYPRGLAVAIVSIAILTCMISSGLLAHSATVARNKLAEIVQTRRKLWSAIAQKENAEAAAAARSEFIASASHEIRTPLHQLQGYSDLLSRTDLTEEGRLLLLAIQRATKTLSMITNNVLDWSRLEKGEATCRPTEFDIRTVCDAIINLLPGKDDEIQPDLMVVVAPNVPTSLYLDETYLQRILMNLLSNALKFTLSGYVLLLIEFKEGNLVATVKDTGFGIPESFLPQLFEPFKQAQIRGAQRGAGLGLSIIQQLLGKMQGEIEVDSKYQQDEGVGPNRSGSTFTVTVPIPAQQDGLELVQPLRQYSKIVIFHSQSDQSLEGLCLAWNKSGFETIVSNTTEVPQIEDDQIVWADLTFLSQHSSFLQFLINQRKAVVLIPYDTQRGLDEVVGPNLPSHILPIRKPMVWHHILQSIRTIDQKTETARLDKTVRFDPKVDVLDDLESRSRNEQANFKKYTVLLVEDNKINQKLGVKMLKTLGYDVLIAEDGQEAIEQVTLHDHIVDLILMDQSMPRKDGLTATKEIREMEADGLLTRKRPIIAVTAVVGPEAQSMCILAGTDTFLPKPLSLAKLEQTLSRYLP